MIVTRVVGNTVYFCAHSNNRCGCTSCNNSIGIGSINVVVCMQRVNSQDDDKTKVVGDVTFLGYQDGSITPIDYSTNTSGITISWSADNATKYTYKAILLANKPTGADNESASALKTIVSDTNNITSITIPKAELKAGCYVKVAVHAYGENALESKNWPWIGFAIHDAPQVVDVLSISPATGGYEGDEFSIKIRTTACMSQLAISYLDGANWKNAKVYYADATDVSIDKTVLGGKYWDWTVKYHFSCSGNDSNGYQRTTYFRTSPDGKVWSTCVESEPFVVQPKQSGAVTKEVTKNLLNDTTLGLGAKKTAVVQIAELLIDQGGFEPAYVAGVLANIVSEGNYGVFESSAYTGNNVYKRPKYFAYLDGGMFYTKNDAGEYVVSKAYVAKADVASYSGPGTAYERYSTENFYRTNYSGKNVTAVSLSGLENLLINLEKGGWQGKFGLGIVQWTGSRTKTLVSFYRKEAGNSDKLTQAQVISAENKMIMNELLGKWYYVYTNWTSANAERLSSVTAANSAGSLVCRNYEVPADTNNKAVARASLAERIYKVMMGQ